MTLKTMIVAALGLLVAASATARDNEKIIDVHLHPDAPLRNSICPASGIIETKYPDGSPVCAKPLVPAANPETLKAETIAAMRRHNMVAVLQGELSAVESYQQAAPGLFIPATAPNGFAPGELASLRKLIEAGKVKFIGELVTQYEGLAPNDPQLEPLYALAEELDVPVGIHVSGLGAPVPTFRAALGDPLLLEEVVARHPRLRLCVMHAGYPFIDRMIALLRRYPQVYVDIAWIDWQMPRSEFHAYLKRLVDHGFGQRIMFGTDQVAWPGAIDLAVESVQSAAFLSASQKRDIFYNNAARFLRLEK